MFAYARERQVNEESGMRGDGMRVSPAEGGANVGP